jgi:hypothetical protein
MASTWRVAFAAAAGLGLAACAERAPQPAIEEARAVPVAELAPELAAAQIGCVPSERMPVAGRASPYDSTRITVGDRTAQICYGRPSMRGRQIFGGLVPLGRLWRTGANEPTILHIPFAATVAGVAVEPGSYSIYTEPGESEWVIIVNRSTSQWGHENSYTPEVAAQEVGRGTAAVERLDAPIETFTIRAEPAGSNEAHVILEWERTRVRFPITAR